MVGRFSLVTLGAGGYGGVLPAGLPLIELEVGDWRGIGGRLTGDWREIGRRLTGDWWDIGVALTGDWGEIGGRLTDTPQ